MLLTNCFINAGNTYFPIFIKGMIKWCDHEEYDIHEIRFLHVIQIFNLENQGHFSIIWSVYSKFRLISIEELTENCTS